MGEKEMTPPISILSLHVYYRIREYLTHTDYISFMNISKKYLNPIKRETIYYSFTKTISLLYIENPKFRFQIDKRINNPNQQIGLILPTVDDYHFRIEKLRKLTILDCSSFKLHFALERLHSISYIKLCNGTITTFPLLRDVIKLSLYSFPYLNKLDGLQNIKGLELKHCPKVSDLSPLSRLIKLSIIFCASISDVSPLGQLRYLTLNSCPLITDITSLSNIYDLKIISCPNIDYSNYYSNNTKFTLGGYNNSNYIKPKHTLNLNHFKKVKFFSFIHNNTSNTINNNNNNNNNTMNHHEGMMNLYELYQLIQLSPDCSFLDRIISFDFSYYNVGGPPSSTVSNIGYDKREKFTLPLPPHTTKQQHYLSFTTLEYNEFYVSKFTNIYSLSICNCSSITNTSLFGHIHSLRFVNCNNLNNLQGLSPFTGNKLVILINCNEIKDFSYINGIDTVIIDTCRGFSSMQHVNQVKHLKLTSIMNELKDISILSSFSSGIERLEFIQCGFTVLNGVSMIPEIHIIECDLLTCQGLGVHDCQRKIVVSESNRISDLWKLEADYTSEIYDKKRVFLRKSSN